MRKPDAAVMRAVRAKRRQAKASQPKPERKPKPRKLIPCAGKPGHGGGGVPFSQNPKETT